MILNLNQLRLYDDEKAVLKQVLDITNYEVYLFGSRTDLKKRAVILIYWYFLNKIHCNYLNS